MAAMLAVSLAEAGFMGVAVIEPKSVAVNPSNKVNVGTKVTIACTWKQTGSVQQHTDWANMKKLAEIKWQLPGEITLDGQKLKTFTVSAANSGGQGTVSVDWVAKTPGQHNGACSVDPANIANIGGTKTINFAISVIQSAPKPGGGSVMQTQPAAPPTAFSPATGPVMPTQPKGLPDITSGSGIVIGGKSAPWGSSVAVDVKSAHSVNMNNSGLCEFGVKHTARNIGLAFTGGFDSVWKNSHVPGSFGRSWLPIAPGGAKEETDLVRLKPGQNLLHLALDNTNKVQEMNENNNRFRIVVNVNGSCGPKPGIVPPASGGKLPSGSLRESETQTGKPAQSSQQNGGQEAKPPSASSSMRPASEGATPAGAGFTPRTIRTEPLTLTGTGATAAIGAGFTPRTIRTEPLTLTGTGGS
jgi:hypothetical protein